MMETQDPRGPLQVPRGGGTARRDRAGWNDGRRGAAARDRGSVRPGGVQRESQNARNQGIRTAIGAGQADVLRLVMGKGLALVGIGTAIGLAMSVGRRAADELDDLQRRRRRLGRLSRGGAGDGAGDDAGGLTYPRGERPESRRHRRSGVSKNVAAISAHSKTLVGDDLQVVPRTAGPEGPALRTRPVPRRTRGSAPTTQLCSAPLSHRRDHSPSQ